MKIFSIFLILFYFLSCTTKVKNGVTFSFIEYYYDELSGYNFNRQNCSCIEENNKEFKVWKYTNCNVPFLWYINIQNKAKSMFLNSESDTTELIIVDSFFVKCFSKDKTQENKVIVLTEKREVIDGNHNYYYNEKYGIFFLKSTAWYSGMELMQVNRTDSDSLQIFLLSARLEIEKIKNR